MPRSSRAGLTLVETALILCLLGVVLAVSIPTFVRAVRTSKIAEANHELSRIAHAAASYYETPQPTAAGKRLRCLPGSAGPTPLVPSQEPVFVHFGAPDGSGSGATWRALSYEPSAPIRYSYSFLPRAAGCGPHKAPPDDDTRDAERHEPLLVIRAEGDLDGDGHRSLFERAADDDEGELRLRPMLTVHDRVE